MTTTIYNLTRKEVLNINDEKEVFTFASLITKGWAITDELVCVDVNNTSYNLFDDGGDENKRLMVSPEYNKNEI